MGSRLIRVHHRTPTLKTIEALAHLDAGYLRKLLHSNRSYSAAPFWGRRVPILPTPQAASLLGMLAQLVAAPPTD
jgi:hypothetical protein